MGFAGALAILRANNARMRQLAVLLIAPFVFSTETLSAWPAATRQDTLNRVQIASNDLDDQLLSIIKSRNGGQIGNDLIRLRRTPEFSWVDFHVVEGRLRKLGTDIYLVAAPFRFHKSVTANVKSVPESNWTSRAVLGDAEDFPYFLWVEVNGHDKFLAKLSELGIGSEDINLESLKRTGILAPRKQ